MIRYPRLLTIQSLVLISLCFGGVRFAKAGSIVFTDPSQFAPTSTLVTFDEGDFNGQFLQPFQVVTSYRGLTFQAPGEPNQPTVFFDPSTPRQYGPGGSAGKTGIQVLFGSTIPVPGLIVTLPALETQFGAEFEAITAGNFTFTLYNNSAQVDVVTIAANSPGQEYYFHAFQDTSAFNEVLIQGPGSGTTDGRVILDNLEYGPASVPEPSSLLLLTSTAIVGLLIRCCARRRLEQLC